MIMNKKLVKTVKKSFKKHYKTKAIMVFSPGRINLIGEHTDYNEGYVFPAAINKGIVLGIQKSNSNKSKVLALDKNEKYKFSLNSTNQLKNGGWKNYIIGVISEIQKLNLKLDNFNIVFAGNIPGGAGMSSSAALENSIVFGLNQLFKLQLSKEEMIIISQKAEHNYVGVKCGIMDQYASMFGKKDSALLLDCRTVESQFYKIDFKEYMLVLINTNVKHNLSESEYNNRRIVCERVSKKLEAKSLRDISIKDLEKFKNDIPEDDYQKVIYVLEENKRVQEFSEAIRKNDIKGLGKLLYKSHKGLSKQYKVSCLELDFLVNETKNYKSIIGARMMGGGFGGCTINLMNKKSKGDLKKITKKYKSKFNIEASIYTVKLSDGVKLV